jgi:hypothetical protein
MSSRSFVAIAWAAALVAGCAGAPARWPLASVPVTTPDPDRFERAVCRLGEYPPDLDARALARARSEDLRARRSGEWSPFAASRLESARAEFDARCAAWRSARLDL